MRDRVFQAAHAADSERGRVFLPSFWKLFLMTGGGGAALLSLLWFVLWMLTPMPPPLATWYLSFLPVLLCVIALEFVFALLLLRGFRVEIADSGITSTDLWGFRRTMTWAEMETVQPTNVMGARYLKVASFRQSRWSLYVPHPMAHPRAFQEAVSHAASPINPLRRSLESGGSTAARERISS